MIDIAAINSTLVQQDSSLRERLAELTEDPSVSASTKALLAMLAEGLAAIHERQGNLIVLMLQSGR